MNEVRLTEPGELLQPGVLGHALEGIDMAKGPYRFAWFNTQFWMHRTVKAMSRDARELYLYLITGPSTNMAGIYYLPWPLALHHLQHTLSDTLSDAVCELKERGRIMYDDEADIVLLVDHLQHNEVVSPKVAIGIVNVVKELPANNLVPAFVASAKRYAPQFAHIWDRLLTGDVDTLSDTLSDTVGDGVHHNSEQGTVNSKQRTERENTPAANAPGAPLSPGLSDMERQVAASAEPPAQGKTKPEWTADQKALVDLLWQFLKKRDALPASAATVKGKPGRFFGAQMTEAARLLAIRSFVDWSACFKWATEVDTYWPERLDNLRVLGEKVWPQFARNNGRGGGAGGGVGGGRGPDKGPNGGGRFGSLVERG